MGKLAIAYDEETGKWCPVIFIKDPDVEEWIPTVIIDMAKYTQRLVQEIEAEMKKFYERRKMEENSTEFPIKLARSITVLKWVVQEHPQEKEYAFDSITRDLAPELIKTLQRLGKPVVVEVKTSETEKDLGPYEFRYAVKMPVIELSMVILIDEIPTESNLNIYNKKDKRS